MFLPKISLTALAIASAAIADPITSALTARSAGIVHRDGNPVVIDSSGVYARATRMNDGRILAAWASYPNGNTVLRSASSSDSGATWDPLGSVLTVSQAARDSDNAFALQLPSGRILYAYRNHDRLNGTYTFYRITISYSEDSGKTWQFLSQVDERPADGFNGFWEPFMRVANDGTVQCYYSAENSAIDQDTLMKWSADSGATWNGPRIVSGGETNSSRDGMSAVAPVNDNNNGKLM